MSFESNSEGLAGLEKKGSWVGKIAGIVVPQLLALAVFVGFPALATAVAPVSWVRLERRDGRVAATARKCLLFVVPYKTEIVDPVVGFGDRTVQGTTSRDRNSGSTTKSEDQGYLVIRGNDQTAEVPVSPVNLKSTVEKADQFLKDEQAAELKLFVVANWKFSVIVGGLLSLLTILYIGVWLFGFLMKAVHAVQWARGVPPQQRWLAKWN